MASAPSPAVRVLNQGRSQVTVSVAGNGTPFWLVLGQSQSRGWQATTAGGRALGTSMLIDGYANGWYVPGALARGTTVFHLTWTPQHVIDAALIVSGASLVGAIGLIALDPPWLGGREVTRRRRRWTRRRTRLATDGSPEAPTDGSPRAASSSSTALVVWRAEFFTQPFGVPMAHMPAGP